MPVSISSDYSLSSVLLFPFHSNNGRVLLLSTMPTQLVTLKKNLYFELDLCNLPELCGRNHVIDLWATCVQK